MMVSVELLMCGLVRPRKHSELLLWSTLKDIWADPGLVQISQVFSRHVAHHRQLLKPRSVNSQKQGVSSDLFSLTDGMSLFWKIRGDVCRLFRKTFLFCRKLELSSSNVRQRGNLLTHYSLCRQNRWSWGTMIHAPDESIKHQCRNFLPSQTSVSFSHPLSQI